jgi:hypothetical protein
MAAAPAAAATAPQAEEARRVVMSLSGRQVEYGRDCTLEGLLVGTWVLFALTALLKKKSAERLLKLADFVLGGSVEPQAARPVLLQDTG